MVWNTPTMMPSPTLPAAGAELQHLQRKRKLALLAGIALWALLLLVTQSRWRSSAPQIYAFIRQFGIVLILACILGRTWCTLYIGGRKKRALITKGPYSLVRNPLYVFTGIGAAGVGAQSGSLLMLALAAAATMLVFHVVVRREEAFLEAAFPGDFAAYAARVPRFWPHLAWQDADELVVKPRLVRRTFFDGCLFLAAVPVADAVGWLHGQGGLPVLAQLP
jgi:protein-S-isoprenylcysteine O-methyltransferase Ste14